MSFLIIQNGQFSNLIYPTPNLMGQIENITPIHELKESQSFKDNLDNSLKEAVHKKINPKIESYQKTKKNHEVMQKRYYARDIMTSPVTTIKEIATAREANEILTKHGFRHIPVVDEKNNISGMISDRELIDVTANQKCKEIMIQKIVVCEGKASIHEMAIIMLSYKINALPIINDKYEMIGIATISDILKYVIDSTAFLGRG
ncbi:MAG: HPP family protein [Bacteriovoracaceae bacterium]